MKYEIGELYYYKHNLSICLNENMDAEENIGIYKRNTPFLLLEFVEKYKVYKIIYKNIVGYVFAWDVKLRKFEATQNFP